MECVIRFFCVLPFFIVHYVIYFFYHLYDVNTFLPLIGCYCNKVFVYHLHHQVIYLFCHLYDAIVH